MSQPNQTVGSGSRPQKRQRSEEPTVEPNKRHQQGVSQGQPAAGRPQQQQQRQPLAEKTYTLINESIPPRKPAKQHRKRESQGQPARPQQQQEPTINNTYKTYNTYNVYNGPTQIVQGNAHAQYASSGGFGAPLQAPSNPYAYAPSSGGFGAPPQAPYLAYQYYNGMPTEQYGPSVNHPQAAQSPAPSTVPDTIDSAKQQLYAAQNQWLDKAEEDYEFQLITTIPGINRRFWSLGDDKTFMDKNLVPSLVWRLRSFGPSKRYVLYHWMVWLARKMVKYDQPSRQFQGLWATLSAFRIQLMKHERDWVAAMKEGTETEIVARLKKTSREQAEDTMLTQAMVDEYKEYEKVRLPELLKLLRAEETTQTQAPTPAQGPESSTTAPASSTSSISEPPQVKPDTVKYPKDLVSVPEYPLDNINDYTPNEETGIYRCRHDFDTGKPCCKTGLTVKKMKLSIQKDIRAWKIRVEKLIKENKLDPRHKTWDHTYDPTPAQKALEKAEKEKAKKEKAKK